MVSVKAELITLIGSEAGVCGVECGARRLCGSGGGSTECSDLAALLQDLLGAKGVVPLHALTVVPGRWQWKLYIDILVLASDGGVVDAAALAACAALQATRLPGLRVLKSGLGGGREEIIDLQLNDDISAAWALPVLATLPLTLTLHYIRGNAVVDATGEELACATAVVSVGMNAGGAVTFLRCHGREGGTSRKNHAGGFGFGFGVGVGVGVEAAVTSPSKPSVSVSATSPKDVGIAISAAKALIPLLFKALPQT